MFTDFFVFFSGVQGGGIWGGDGAVDRARGGLPLKESDVPVFTPRPNAELKRLGWFGSVANARGIDAAFHAIALASGYQPGSSRLVMYGHSAGAANLLVLCRRFDHHNAASQGNRQVTVDFLVTVDAALQEKTDTIDRTVARCVKRNLNFWQDSSIVAQALKWSRGGPNRGECNPDNRHLKGEWKLDGERVQVDHANIDRICWPECQHSIQKVLKAP